MFKSPLFRTLLLANALGLAAAPFAMAESTPKDPQYIIYKNDGEYVVNGITLKWKDGSTTKQKAFSKNLAYLDKSCIDLSKVSNDNGDGIPLGAEVWLEVRIQGGGTKNCRKDNKHYYQLSGNSWLLKTAGNLMGGNHCQNYTRYQGTQPDFEGGNSKDCNTKAP